MSKQIYNFDEEFRINETIGNFVSGIFIYAKIIDIYGNVEVLVSFRNAPVLAGSGIFLLQVFIQNLLMIYGYILFFIEVVMFVNI